MAEKVLIVDDDRNVLSSIYRVVQSAGIGADTAGVGEEALKKLSENRYDLMLLDINMYDMSGFKVIEAVRARGDGTPIIIVSARADDCDTLYGLDIGADDYITKPFNPAILGAKVKALIRRSQSSDSSADTVITAGPFRYNTSTLRIYKNGEEIYLSSKENAIMKLFMDNVNRVFTKDSIYELIWGNELVDEKAVMVYINRVRQKIEDDPSKPVYLQTVRGLGYRFVV